jgi:hypothetical protein
MTKAELIRRLAAVPDDAEIEVVDLDGEASHSIRDAGLDTNLRMPWGGVIFLGEPTADLR